MRKPAPRPDRSPRARQPRLDGVQVQELTDWEETETRLRALSRGLLQRHDQERRRIACELHDSAAQSLSVACMTLSQLDAAGIRLGGKVRSVLRESRTLIDRGLQEIRTICYALHPPLLDEAGLASALSWYVEDFEKDSGIRLELDLSNNLQRLPSDVEMAVFSIAQESLTNIRMHSNSRTAQVSVEVSPRGILLSISDQGSGISGETLEEIKAGAHTGVGISSMRERAAHLGGRLEITSSKRGTCIRSMIPLPGGDS